MYVNYAYLLGMYVYKCCLFSYSVLYIKMINGDMLKYDSEPVIHMYTYIGIYITITVGS